MTGKAVIVISSHVARGTVGNRAAVFALEALAHPVWAVPTIMLPWHPGHGPATRIVAGSDDFAAFLNDLENAPWLDEVSAVLTGYLGDASQAKPIASLVTAVKERTPDALYVCDPVIGDHGGLYVPEATAAAIRDTLLPLADVATPNRFELAWLTGRGPFETSTEILDAAGALPAGCVLTTSAIAMMRDATGSILSGPGGAFMAEHRHMDGVPNGLGDLTAALLTHHLLSGRQPEETLAMTTASVYEILVHSRKSGANELVLEGHTGSLSRPMTRVQTRRLG